MLIDFDRTYRWPRVTVVHSRGWRDYDEKADLTDASDASAVELWRTECLYRDSTKTRFAAEYKTYFTYCTYSTSPSRSLLSHLLWLHRHISKFTGHPDRCKRNHPGIYKRYESARIWFHWSSDCQLHKRLISLGALHGDVRLPNIIVWDDDC